VSVRHRVLRACDSELGKCCCGLCRWRGASRPW
jgi:hypothetical protein